VIKTKIQTPRNFPSTNSDSWMGFADSHSRVPLLRSSARLLMVAAGTNTARRTGRRSKKGRSEAAPEAYMVRKVRKRESPRKATARR
jgi:hypothetical protein